MVLALFVASCSAAATTPPLTSTAHPIASPTLSSTTAPPATPSSLAATPVPSVSATATPAPIPPAGWLGPRLVGFASDCHNVVALLDTRGVGHLAATCGNGVAYADAKASGWTVHALTPPADRMELDPQLALDGNVLYLAYSRVAPAGGCGSPGYSDVGVWYRTRTLPSGAWSAPRQIGRTYDHLQSLAVRGGTIAATSNNDHDDGRYLDIVRGASDRRLALSHADGLSSVQIGPDGRVRLAYEVEATTLDGWGSIRFALVGSAGPVVTTVPDTAKGYAPVLGIAPSGAYDLLWERGYHGLGCVGGGSDPLDGTYFATDIGGHWTASRLSTALGQTAMALDPSTGAAHILLSSDGGPRDQVLSYYLRSPAGVWTDVSLLPSAVASPTISVDRTGAVLVAFIGYTTDRNGSTVFVMTRP